MYEKAFEGAKMQCDTLASSEIPCQEKIPLSSRQTNHFHVLEEFPRQEEPVGHVRKRSSKQSQTAQGVF